MSSDDRAAERQAPDPRAQRAERLARLRAAASAGAPTEACVVDPRRPPPAQHGAVVRFHRPGAGTAAAPGDLHLLPGAGPGLVWALERAGLARIADLAPLAPQDLAGRLGPLGRLAPVAAWVDAAQGCQK